MEGQKSCTAILTENMVTQQLKLKEVVIDIRKLEKHRNMLESGRKAIMLTPPAEKKDGNIKRKIIIYGSVNLSNKQTGLAPENEVEKVLVELKLHSTPEELDMVL